MATIKDYYNQGFFDNFGNKNEPIEIKEFLEKEKEFLKKYLKPNSKVLEIGCGEGRLLEQIAKNHALVYGIDFAENMIRKAKRKLNTYENTNVFHMDAQNLLFIDNFFDYSLCMCSSFSNMPGIEERVVQEMTRVTKPGGEILIHVLSSKVKSIHEELYRSMGLTNIVTKGNVTRTAEGIISRRFSEEDLHKIMKTTQLKYEITKICDIGYLVIGKK